MNTSSPVRLVQRKCACGTVAKSGGDCAECRAKRELHRQAAGTGPEIAPPIVYQVLASPGQPLPASERAFFEPRFGHDFSQVRIHVDGRAAESADAVNASAYTVGQDLVFARGQYSPGTVAGEQLLAHELTHTLQHRGGVGSAWTPHTIALPHDPVEREAESTAEAVMRGRTQSPVLTSSGLLARQGTPAAPPAPTTEDCEPWQTTMLTDHLNFARTWVDDAEPKINALATGATSAYTGVVTTALNDNFHTTTPADVRTIADNFASLRTELNSNLTFECEDEGCEDQAYVRGAFAPIRRLGDIHVCPPWFNCRDYFRRVTTLIHERAHQYPGATDNAYEWEASYATLSSSDAIDNAESYAVAARQIYHGGARGPGMPSC